MPYEYHLLRKQQQQQITVLIFCLRISQKPLQEGTWWMIQIPVTLPTIFIRNMPLLQHGSVHLQSLEHYSQGTTSSIAPLLVAEVII